MLMERAWLTSDTYTEQLIPKIAQMLEKRV